MLIQVNKLSFPIQNYFIFDSDNNLVLSCRAIVSRGNRLYF